mgnify:CR=1 FL=1
MHRFKLWRSQTPKGNTAGKRTSIANHLRWSYLISSTLPLLLVGVLLLKISTDSQQRQIYNDQLGLASRVARDISRYIVNLQEQIDISMRPNAALDQSLDQLSEAAITLTVRNSPNIIDLSLIDQTGRERLRIHQLLRIPDEQLRDWSGDADVTQVIQSGQTHYSSIITSPNNTQSFIMTMPLYNAAGLLVGAIRTEISAEPIKSELKFSDVGENSYAYLIDSTTQQVLLDNDEPNFSPPPELRLLLASQTNTSTYIGVGNENVLGAVQSVNELNVVAPDWAVVVEQPVNVAFASVRRSIGLLTMLVIVAGFSALAWAFYQARHFLLPLKALREGALALSKGQLDHRIQSCRDDELGDVARTFNQMATHLQESLAEIERRNERALHGLALARDIQIGLLPERPPWNGDIIEVHARSIPAYEVGGDFYTYLALSEGRAAIAIGDISGKGVGAALLMALTSSAVESQGRELEHPAQVLHALNQSLAPRLKANNMNAALLFAVIDPHRRVMHVANAGMIAPILISSEGNHFIEAGGLPLGAFAGAIYQEHTVPLHPGDALLFLSDGVVEAHNEHGELFGFERLEATVLEHHTTDVRELVDVVIERVQHFMGNTEQHDDITMVAVRPSISFAEPALHEEQEASYATI